MSLRAAHSSLRDLLAHSLDLIVSHQAPSGAFPAAPTYPVYRYSWFRDGAFIAEGISRFGAVAEADAFHQWCAARINERRVAVEGVVARLKAGKHVPHEDFLPTRYTLEGGEAAESWWDFQTDGYGAWLWALHAHLHRHHLDPSPYASAVATTADYLQHAWHEPCYDWWEENPDQWHVSTLAAIVAGLDAALRLRVLDTELANDVRMQRHVITQTILTRGRVDGHLVKWLGSRNVDGSLLACVAPFRLVDSATARATLDAVDKDLLFEQGVYRYRDDTFYGGGRWPVLAAFRGLALATLDRTAEAKAALEWIASVATENFYLPEQVGPRLLFPDREAEWIERWGPVATPLLWSHAMFLTLADTLGMQL